MGIKCFFITPLVDLWDFKLRRYHHSDSETPEAKCPNGWIHDTSFSLGRHPASFAPSGKPSCGDLWPHDDPRWPTACSCGYQFKEEDEWQLFTETVYERHDNKEQLTLRSAPVGAMWFADWMTFYQQGSCDGHVLGVRLPGNHDWMPEQRASNCDSPCKHCNQPYANHRNEKGEMSGRCKPTWTYNDGNPHYEDARPHKCWVRHGTPPHQIVHVDKSGTTCGAGGGSIAYPGWHGFLHNGELVG